MATARDSRISSCQRRSHSVSRRIHTDIGHHCASATNHATGPKGNAVYHCPTMPFTPDMMKVSRLREHLCQSRPRDWWVLQLAGVAARLGFDRKRHTCTAAHIFPVARLLRLLMK